MDANIMKRMIVLKNLQSNMIDEAYVVFKNNVKIRKYEKINNEKDKMEKDKKNDKDYMIKEAEMIVNEYISKIENKNTNLQQIEQNYKRLKIFTISLCLFSTLNFILFLLK